MENISFEAKYFKIQDEGFDPQQQEAGTDKIYAQVSTKINREQHDSLVGVEVNKAKGRFLMVFNDKSGSMSGLPFTTLKEANVQLLETLFPEGK